MTQTTESEILLCAFGCGKPVHNGARLCKGHLKHQRIKMAEYRQQRKAKGLCSRCDNEARKLADGTPSTLCEDCRTHVRSLEQSRAQRKRILNLKAAGLTVRQIGIQEALATADVKAILESA
jgi:hypothetical protein